MFPPPLLIEISSTYAREGGRWVLIHTWVIPVLIHFLLGGKKRDLPLWLARLFILLSPQPSPLRGSVFVFFFF